MGKKKNRNKTASKTHKVQLTHELINCLSKPEQTESVLIYLQGYFDINTASNLVEKAQARLKRRQVWDPRIAELSKSPHALTTAIAIIRFHSATRSRGAAKIGPLLSGGTPFPMLITEITPVAIAASQTNGIGSVFPDFSVEYAVLFLSCIWGMSAIGKMPDLGLRACNELSIHMADMDLNTVVKSTLPDLLPKEIIPTMKELKYMLGVVGVRVCKALNRLTHIDSPRGAVPNPFSKAVIYERYLYYAKMQIDALPLKSEGHLDLGVVLMRSKRLDEAASAFRMAMELAEKNGDDVALGIASIELAGVMCQGYGTDGTDGTVTNGAVRKIWKISVDAVSRCDKWGMKMHVLVSLRITTVEWYIFSWSFLFYCFWFSLTDISFLFLFFFYLYLLYYLYRLNQACLNL